MKHEHANLRIVISRSQLVKTFENARFQSSYINGFLQSLDQFKSLYTNFQILGIFKNTTYSRHQISLKMLIFEVFKQFADLIQSKQLEFWNATFETFLDERHQMLTKFVR